MTAARIKRINLVVIVVLVAAVMAAVWYLRGPRSSPNHPAPGSGTGSAAAGRGISGAGGGGETDEPAGDPRIRTIDADQRLALMQRIETARAARKAGKPAAPPSSGGADDDPPPLAGELSPDQIMEGVKAVHPLLLECYEHALDTLPAKDRNGKVVVTMTIGGEPDIGTLIETAELEGSPHLLANTDFASCIQETTMSVELPPLTEGSQIVAKLPMVFSVADPDASGR